MNLTFEDYDTVYENVEHVMTEQQAQKVYNLRIKKGYSWAKIFLECKEDIPLTSGDIDEIDPILIGMIICDCAQSVLKNENPEW